MPAPETVIPVAPVRLVPVRVTGTVVPRIPDVGAIETKVGPSTLNVTALVVPFGVVTVTFRAVRPAVSEIVNVAVIVVSFTTVRLPTVMPAPDTATAVAPVRPAPVSVTGTAWPRKPEFGLIDDRLGAR